jgi:hypothetical protein
MSEKRELIKIQEFPDQGPGAGMYMLPAAPGTCEECATAHDPTYPHNKQSLFYQYRFYFKENRWPTWEDAMAHCSDKMKEAWRQELTKLGQKLI